MTLDSKNWKAMELSLSDDIVYGNKTCFAPWCMQVYGARTKRHTKRHGASEADSEHLGRSNLGTCSANVPRCVVDADRKLTS
jgi:hypothetical protein